MEPHVFALTLLSLIQAVASQQIWDIVSLSISSCADNGKNTNLRIGCSGKLHGIGPNSSRL